MTLPVSGIATKYRPFLVKEEKVLLIALQSDDPNQVIDAIRNIILSCTYNSIDTKKIPAADSSYAMLQIRAKSIGEEVKPSIKCGNCQTSTPVRINVEKISLSVDEPKEKLSPNIKISDEVTLIMRQPTIHDLDVTKDQTTMLFEMVFSCIDKVMYKDKVYDRGDVNEEDVLLLGDSLLPQQFKQIADYLNSSPSLSYHFDYICPSCKSKVNVDLKSISDFFL